MLRKRFIACTAISLASIITAPVIAADDAASRLSACQAIAVDADRLDCYDAIASSMAAADVPAEIPAKVSEVQSAAAPSDKPPPLTDDVSKVSVKGANIEQPIYSTVVTACKRSEQEQRTFFYLENGQVWKQSDAGRLRLENKECQFEATIEKKAFGWRLRIPSEDRVIRVFRVR